ncbi:hypothetical protein [Sanguibacter antarcticus]|uniref:Nuclear transport factor 2 family protein n=1 Tax=Sanguibacter antarcticus TaxID=372484 RepID=A0A2A9E7M1_9MICO|nr:hypothetical protein [Sanguibacter antarcticus]PFG34646.1 hypothetical protein ATL42_2563 [Sanguibacter antarcticus]
MSPTISAVLVATILTGCASSKGPPDPERDNSTPDAALAAIFAELHEGDVEEACTYFDDEFEKTFDEDGDCEKVLSPFDEEERELMADIEIDGDFAYHYDNGTVFIPLTAIFWPDGGRRGDGGLFVERDNGWFRTFDPNP